jgi:hypothetical protein
MKVVEGGTAAINNRKSWITANRQLPAKQSTDNNLTFPHKFPLSRAPAEKIRPISPPTQLRILKTDISIK